MKKLLVALLLGMGAIRPLFADDMAKAPIGPFGGLNNRDSSMVIPSNQAQDLLNVNITLNGKSVKKRPGYAQAFALQYTTASVHGTYLFYNSAGNDVVLAFHDHDISASVAGGSMTVLYTTATNNSTFQCSDYLGFAYCADSSRDALFKTDGAGVAQVNSIVSTGTMVVACPTRLAMAGFSGSPARIDLSADTDFTSWGTGSLGSSPVQLTITSPGSRITHITYAFGRLMWFKETSFGYVLIGNQPLQTDWVIKTISNTIGTLDNSSAQDFNGNLYFRGQDGHIYVFDGANVNKLSREIEGTINTASTRISDSLTLTSASDWTVGTLSGAGGGTLYVDTETVIGNLQTTFPDLFDAFRDGTNSTKGVWTGQVALANNCLATAIGTETVSGGLLNLSRTGTSGTDCTTGTPIGIRTTLRYPILISGTTVHFHITTLPYVATNLGQEDSFEIRLSTFIQTKFDSTPTVSVRIYNANASNGCNVYAVSNTDTSAAPILGATLPFDLDFWFSTNSYSITMGGSNAQGNWSVKNSDFITNMSTTNYIYLLYWGNHIPTSTMTGDTFNIVPETFTFTSASKTVNSAITSWDSFTTTKNDPSDPIAFGLRFGAGNSYTTTTPGTVPAIATTTFWQMISTFSMTTSTAIAPVSLSDATQNWFEGSASDKAYAGFFDDKVMFSVPIGAGQSTNNRILVYDLLYQGWTLWDLPVNGFYIRNNALYFGSSNGGYVYKYGVGNNDAGSAINSYWKSKDFFGGSPFNNTVLTDLSVAANSVANSSMTITYVTDGATTGSFTMGLGSGTGVTIKNKQLPLGVNGNIYNVKFGNNAADQPWEVFGVQVGITSKPWRAN